MCIHVKKETASSYMFAYTISGSDTLPVLFLSLFFFLKLSKIIQPKLTCIDSNIQNADCASRGLCSMNK